MSTREDDFVAHCLELLSTLGSVRARCMFGGHGLYIDELFVALIASEQLYLKVDAHTQAHFESAGCAPFVYDKKGKAVSMSYWCAPEDALESPALMQPWAQLALAAALRARAAKRVSARKPVTAAAARRSTSRSAPKAKR